CPAGAAGRSGSRRDSRRDHDPFGRRSRARRGFSASRGGVHPQAGNARSARCLPRLIRDILVPRRVSASSKRMSELRLLIVDDDEADRIALRRAAAAWDAGATIEAMPNANGRPEALASGRSDCVVLAYGLQGAPALEIVRRLREAGIQVPILAVTGADDTVGTQLVAAGATDFLPKSDLEPARLVRRIRHAVRLGRAEARERAIQRE